MCKGKAHVTGLVSSGGNRPHTLTWKSSLLGPVFAKQYVFSVGLWIHVVCLSSIVALSVCIW